MLAPRLILFTPASLLAPPTRTAETLGEALSQIEIQNVPLVLSTKGTRAEIELLRRKISHGHPFITEAGGGLFVPDGYFSLRLGGATRAGRYFCIPFGRSSQEASDKVQEIAQTVGAEVVRYAEMTPREISRNTGMNEREAEASAQREFSERFYFAGNSDLAAPAFEKAASGANWSVRRFEPWWELFSGNDEGKAVRRLMQLYRQALRSRVKSVAIGTSAEDLGLLAASDQAFVLPQAPDQFDEVLLSRLPQVVRSAVSGSLGWKETVLSILSRI